MKKEVDVNESVVTNTSFNMIEAITKVGHKVLDDSLSQIDLKVSSLIKDYTEKIATLESEKPVFRVQINDQKVKKLKQRKVPYLGRMLINAKLGFNTLLVGPAGCGKTTAAKQLSEALDLGFGSVCLTAGASETWLFGRHTPKGFIEGVFSKMYKEGGVFLADEMDAADANLLLAINTALANGYMFNPMSGEQVEKHKDFIFVGAANTFGKGATHVYTGRARLDAATLDRFVIIEVNYDKTIEKVLCEHVILRDILWYVRKELQSEGFDEVISSRAFEYCYKQFQAGVKIKDIFDSMSSSWNKDARAILMRTFKDKRHLLEPAKEIEGGVRVEINNMPAVPANMRMPTDYAKGASSAYPF